MSNKMEQTTTVQEIDVNLDEIFNGAPGAGSVVTPEKETKKPNVFSKADNVDLSFLDDGSINNQTEEESKQDSKEADSTTGEADKADASGSTETAKAAEGGDTTPGSTVTKDEVDEILNEGLDLAESEEEKSTAKGRRRINDMADVFKKMIENEEIIPFDDDKDLDDYTAKDWKELIQANMAERANKVRRETPKQFFNSLPQELQVAAKYVADGGTDLKGLFGALAQTEEVRQLSLADEDGQAHIVREYLTATGYGTPEDIQEEIEIWKDLGKLEKQAAKFKPKLDKMQEQVVARKLQQQEQMKAQQQKASENYMANVYHTLKDGKIGDLKVNKKTQSLLYNGLVNPSYPSINGQNTNLLGHLLEKYQFVEPNYNLVTEALWLLADPKGYKEQLMTKGTNKAVEQTVRKLKTAQSTKTASTGGVAEAKASRKRTLPRNPNIFKRF
tara:strand:+ start:4668 stop:6002 length:1335 start_codon:yes stop_codon:yes gene_type:complete